MEKEVWKSANSGLCVVSNVMPQMSTNDNKEFKLEKEYYGGYLIAESIPDKEKFNIIVAALEMLEVLETIDNFLETIDNDANQVPDWLFKQIKDVIKKAKG